MTRDEARAGRQRLPRRCRLGWSCWHADGKRRRRVPALALVRRWVQRIWGLMNRTRLTLTIARGRRSWERRGRGRRRRRTWPEAVVVEPHPQLLNRPLRFCAQRRLQRGDRVLCLVCRADHVVALREEEQRRVGEVGRAHGRRPPGNIRQAERVFGGGEVIEAAGSLVASSAGTGTAAAAATTATASGKKTGGIGGTVS